MFTAQKKRANYSMERLISEKIESFANNEDNIIVNNKNFK